MNHLGEFETWSYSLKSYHSVGHSHFCVGLAWESHYGRLSVYILNVLSDLYLASPRLMLIWCVVGVMVFCICCIGETIAWDVCIESLWHITVSQILHVCKYLTTLKAVISTLIIIYDPIATLWSYCNIMILLQHYDPIASSFMILLQHYDPIATL